MGFIDTYSASVVRLPFLHLFGAIGLPLLLGGLAFALKSDVRPEFDKASKGFMNRGAHGPPRAIHGLVAAVALPPQMLSHHPSACTPHTCLYGLQAPTWLAAS